MHEFLLLVLLSDGGFSHRRILASWCGSEHLTLPLACLQCCLPWFYSAPLSVTAGFDPDRCGTASTSISTEKPRTHWGKTLIKAAGCFWFMLFNSQYFQSNQSAEIGFAFFFSPNYESMKAGRVQKSSAILGTKKHRLFIIHTSPFKVSAFYFGCCLALHKAGQWRERQGYQANEKQLGQVPSLNQACKLNEAHTIDFRVIHCLLWM